MQAGAARSGDSGQGAAPPDKDMGPDRDGHGGQVQGTELPGAVRDRETLLEEQEVHQAVLPQRGRQG